MIELAHGSLVSPAEPAAFFRRWADMSTWPEWNTDTAWVKLDGPFVQGATGTLKPKGGPKVRFVVKSLVDGSEFVDESKLFGAKLTFAHHVFVDDAGTHVGVDVTLDGPLALIWKAILGKDIAASVQPDLDRLAAVAESGALDDR